MYGNKGGIGSLKQIKQKEFQTNNASLANGDNQEVINNKFATFIQLTKTFMDPENLSYKGVFDSLDILRLNIPSPNLGDYAFTRNESDIYICGTLGQWNLNLGQNSTNQIGVILDNVPSDANTLNKLNNKLLTLLDAKQNLLINPVTGIGSANQVAKFTGTGSAVQGLTLSTVATSGSYTDLTNKPTKLSDFTNDIGAGGGSGGSVSINFETSTSNIKMDGTVSVGSSSNAARSDHVHPTDTTRMAIVSGAVSGDILTTNSSGQAIDSGKKFSVDSTFAGNSDANIPTEKAVKGYVDLSSVVDRNRSNHIGTQDISTTTTGNLPYSRVSGLSTVANTGSYTDLISKPTKLSDFTNDIGIGGGVSSVNSRTGAVTLSKSDVGLSNVDNTTDLNKPISTATQTALNLKQNASDNSLNTTSKTITGAINELFVSKAEDSAVLHLNGIETVLGAKTFSAEIKLSNLTASERLELDSNKNVVSVAKGTADNQNFETSTSNIQMNGTVSVGFSSNIARADHVHPSDTTKQNIISSPTANDIVTVNINGQVQDSGKKFSIDSTFAGNSDANIPTEKAVKGYVDTSLANFGGNDTSNSFETIDFAPLLNNANVYEIFPIQLTKSLNYFKVINNNLSSLLIIPAYDQSFENKKIIIENRGSEILSLDIDGSQYEIPYADTNEEDFIFMVCHYLNGELRIL